MAKSKDDQLTSVKVNTTLFEEFKVLGIRTKIDFHKLVNRSLDLYLTNEEFRRQIGNHLSNQFVSGSN